MTGFTVPLGFPYPQATDPADAPAQIQALAEAVDTAMTTTETQLANITDPPIAWFGAAPAVIPNALGTALIWTSEFFDNAGMVDLVTTPTEIVIQSNGFYMIGCEVGFEPNGTGGRQVEILANGVTLPNAFQGSAPPTTLNQGWSCNASVMRVCVAGDRISFRAGHTAGIAITTNGAEGYVFRVSA
jgi:hypothetical protein